MLNQILKLIELIRNAPTSISDERLPEYIDTLLSGIYASKSKDEVDAICEDLIGAISEHALILLMRSLEA